MATIKHIANLDLTKQELRQAVIQRLSTAPSAPAEGQIYYNTVDDTVYFYDGTGWIDMGQSGGGGGDVSVSGTPTSGQYARWTNSTTIAGVTASTVRTDINVADGADVTQTYIAGQGTKATPLDADGFVLQDSADSNLLKKVTGTNLKAFLKTYFDTLYTSADIDTLKLIGGINASTNPNYPSASAGDVHYITHSGRIGGGSGAVVEVGDKVIAIADNAGGTQAGVGSSWIIVQANVDAATDTTRGLVELATSAEAEAKSDTTRALTPASIANFPQKKTFAIGDGSATQIDVTHNLGNKNVIVQLREVATDEVVLAQITMFSDNVVRLNFGVAPTSNAIGVVVIG